jgi:23S rRNA pseudouridine1911/1915/1917 synthase
VTDVGPPHAAAGEHVVDAEVGQRLDAIVAAACPGLSRRLVHRLIDEGVVRVNGRPASKGLRLCAGDRVSGLVIPTLHPEPDLPVGIVHEDADLVLLDKPGGLPSHALDPRQRGSVAAFVLGRWPETAGVGDRLAPGLVHRLDTGTSGLLAVARSVATWAALRDAFRARAVTKRYLAVVQGTPPPRLEMRTPLAHDARDRRRMTAAGGLQKRWPAETQLEALAPAVDGTLVALTMRTGVTHQLRVHCALAGFPVLGDALYGAPHPALAPGRHALHAAALSLPALGEHAPWTAIAPLPPELRALVRAGG